MVLVFLKARGCLLFNNTEEVQPRHLQLWDGVDGFRLYVSLIAIEEFGGNGSNTSAEVKNLWLWDFEVSRFEGARL